MKQVILKQLNMEKYKRREIEEQPDTSDQEPSQDGGNDQQLGLEFSDSLYDDAEQEIQSIWKAEDITYLKTKKCIERGEESDI